MVCLHCGSETRVINSRLQKRNNQVWRRRQCLKCRAIFTTEETVNYGAAWAVRDKSGSHRPFLTDKLVFSLYASLQHRKTALSDAVELSQTVIKKLRPQLADGMIDSGSIARIAQVALNRFDKAASVHYQAHHRG